MPWLAVELLGSGSGLKAGKTTASGSHVDYSGVGCLSSTIRLASNSEEDATASYK